MFSISISHEKMAKILSWKIRENKAVLWCLTIDHDRVIFTRKIAEKYLILNGKLTELA